MFHADSLLLFLSDVDIPKKKNKTKKIFFYHYGTSPPQVVSKNFFSSKI